MSAAPEHLELPNRQPVQTIAVCGGKGGIGKTNVAANLALSLGALGRRVLLLDGDMSMGNLHCLMNLKAPHNLSHVMNGERSLDEVMVETAHGVRLIPGATGAMELAGLSQIEHASVIGLFSDLAVDADTLVIDIATGLSNSVISFCQAAREVMLVVCDEPTSMQDAFSMIRVLNESCQIRRFRVVANKTESSRHGLDLYSALTRYTDRHLDVLLDFCGSIPFDAQLRQAVKQQKPVVDSYPRSPSALAFRKLATRVERWPRPQSPGGQIEFFVERLIQTAEGNRVRR